MATQALLPRFARALFGKIGSGRFGLGRSTSAPVPPRSDRPDGSATPWREPFWPFDRFTTIGVVLLVAIAVGDVIIISMQRDATIAAYETATTNLARGMSAQTEHMLKQVDTLLTNVATVSASGDEGGHRLVALLRDEGKPLAELASFAVTDASGHVVAATPGGAGEGADVSASSFYTALRASGAQPLHVEAGDDGFILARRFTDAHDRFAGVAIATLHPSALRDFYKIAMPPKRAVTLMSKDGAVLTQYPNAETGARASAAHPDRLAVNPGACVAYFGPDLLNEAPVVAAVCQFNGLPFALETSAAAAEALAFWKQERVWLVVGGVFASLVVVWLLYAFARQVRRLEISELSLAAEKREAEAAHRQLDVALSNIIQGVSFFDADRRLIVANRRYRELYDLPVDVVRPGAKLSDIVAAIRNRVGLRDESGESFLASIERDRRTRTPRAFDLELANGRTLALRSQPLADGGFVATHEDITERRQAEQRISYLATHDLLTGLVNRSVLTERLGILAASVTRDRSFAVLFIDLDRFKTVNDTFGHDVGDAVLKQAARRLKETARGICARFGGDEFVILLTDVVSREAVGQLARQLIDAVSAPYSIGRREVEIGASIGIELSQDEPVSADTLLRNADIALYMAKAQGRGVYRFFEAAGMEPGKGACLVAAE